MEKSKRIERNKLILELYKQGISFRKISKQVGLSKSGVHRVISSAKLTTTKDGSSQKPIKMSLAIRNRLKQRKHMKELVEELKRDVSETNRIIERYENTIKLLNFELQDYDNKNLKHKN
jgi:transposase